MPVAKTGPTRPRPALERFWEKVNKTNNCWLWTGATAHGYGKFGPGSGAAIVNAHRFSWEIAHGQIGNGLWVLHKCDVRNCIRPEHLFLGTAKDNTADMDAKGRRGATGARGERNGRRVLGELQVVEIRNRYATGTMRQEDLATEFGVSQGIISKVVRRYSWKHVG